MEQLTKYTQQLTTGKRINQASDDASGLQISTRMTSQIRGTTKAIDNIKDGKNLLQTVDGSLGSIQDILQRARELAVQGQNGTYTVEQKKVIDKELMSLAASIDTISKNTKYNDIPLLTANTAVKLSGVASENQRVKINDIAVNKTPGEKTTVEFWMNWDGLSEIAKPFGWDTFYNLGFQGVVEPAFGFNTGTSNILGIPSEGLKNKWVHVAAVFVNGLPNPNNIALYINGEKQTLREMLPSNPTVSSRPVTNNVTLGGWGPNENYDFGGSLDELKIWDGERTGDEIKTDMYQTNTVDDEDLLGYWKFDDEKLLDETKNGNNGELVNGATLSTNGISKSLTIHSDAAYNGIDYIGLFSITAETLNVTNLSVNDSTILNKIDTAINAVSMQRVNVGTKINQYEFKLDNQYNYLTNTQTSRMRITDVDMSSAMADMTKEEIKMSSLQKMMKMNWSNYEEKMQQLVK